MYCFTFCFRFVLVFVVIPPKVTQVRLSPAEKRFLSENIESDFAYCDKYNRGVVCLSVTLVHCAKPLDGMKCNFPQLKHCRVQHRIRQGPRETKILING